MTSQASRSDLCKQSRFLHKNRGSFVTFLEQDNCRQFQFPKVLMGSELFNLKVPKCPRDGGVPGEFWRIPFGKIWED